MGVFVKKKKKIIKISALILVCILIISIIAFGIYVSDYYHAEEYDMIYDNVIEKKNYIIYGGLEAEKGFIFYPGAKVEEKAYEPILNQIKEEVCCILVKMPFHLAVLNPDAAKEVIEDIPQIQKWYVGGHSLGGAMAAEFAAYDKRVQGLILLAAYPTKELNDIPVLSLYGSEDGVLNMEKYTSSIGLASDVTEILIEGGNHAQFGNYGEQSKDKQARISAEEQWRETAEQIITFIKEN